MATTTDIMNNTDAVPLLVAVDGQPSISENRVEKLCPIAESLREWVFRLLFAVMICSPAISGYVITPNNANFGGHGSFLQPPKLDRDQKALLSELGKLSGKSGFGGKLEVEMKRIEELMKEVKEMPKTHSVREILNQAKTRVKAIRVQQTSGPLHGHRMTKLIEKLTAHVTKNPELRHVLEPLIESIDGRRRDSLSLQDASDYMLEAGKRKFFRLNGVETKNFAGVVAALKLIADGLGCVDNDGNGFILPKIGIDRKSRVDIGNIKLRFDRVITALQKLVSRV